MHDIKSISRRGFLKASAAAAGTALLLQAGARNVWGAPGGSDRLRVGLIGCGGRGVGAAKNCLDAARGVEIVALADLFSKQVEAAATKFKVAPDRCFSGFDSYEKVLKAGVDLVILAAPPVFRPAHFAAAVAAGKHVFMEKPVAVDPVGCRKIIEAANLAKEKNLAVVAGTQRRHQASYIETMRRIHDGDIGELVGGQCYWNGGGIWYRSKTDPKKAPKNEWLAGLSDFEWQCWNWYHWDWLSGDQVVEQHIHNIDIMNWCFNGPPQKILASGGRQTRDSIILPLVKDSPDFKRMGQTDGHPNILGNIYDNISAELEYANGARVMSMCRHYPRSADRVGERIVGTKGSSNCRDNITGEKPFKYSEGGEPKNPYVQEHVDLIQSIRTNNPINEGVSVAEATLTAVGIRMSAYTGREFQWKWLMNASKLDITPKQFAAGEGLFPTIAIPGKTQLV